VIAERIISFGRQYLGTRYVYGGNSLTGGIDCSSFTMQCFATQGIRLPRVSYQQAQCGYALPMDMSQWLPGDLVFYAPHGYVSHVAIYIGNGQILQSAESMGGVCITSVYYNGFKPCSARRVF
jgi:cell wall-associated NlpC family hydrolase